MKCLLISLLLLGLSTFGGGLCADTFSKGRALFDLHELDKALPLLEETTSGEAGEAEALAYLAETYRRLGRREEALRTAFDALALEPCHSFAHTVIAETCRKRPEAKRSTSDTTWVHLLEAVRCDSSDGNAWLSIWNDAIFHNKWIAMETAILMMEQTGFFTPAALEFGRWMLRTVPPDAILITNGDMDTYPLLVCQAAEGFRKDVTIVERGLLGTTDFLRYLKERHNLPVPFSESKIEVLLGSREMEENYLYLSDLVFEAWIEMKKGGKLDRPIALAITLDRAVIARERDHLRNAGPFYLWQSDRVDQKNDRVELQKSIAAIEPTAFSGPWVSAQDRSPVRRVTTYRLAGNISHSVFVYVEELIAAGEYESARLFLSWIEEFEKETRLGPILADQIAELRTKIEERR